MRPDRVEGLDAHFGGLDFVAVQEEDHVELLLGYDSREIPFPRFHVLTALRANAPHIQLDI